MAILVPFNSFVYDLGNGANVPGVHQLKLGLTDVLPVVTLSRYNQITEIGAGPGGYVAGGYPLTVNLDTQVSGLWTLGVANLAVVAAGTIMNQWRYAVIYDSATGSLIGFSDYGAEVVLAVSEVINFTFDPINGIIQGVASSG